MTRLVRADLHPPRVLVLLLALLVAVPACQHMTAAGESSAAAPGELPVASGAAVAVEQPDAQPAAAAPTIEQSLVELLGDMRVRLLPDATGVEVDGRVNMDRGPVEVFACAPGGKTHESVVVVDCVPSGVHAGLLALGLSQGHAFGRDADGNVLPPSGDGVRVEVHWTDAAGQPQVARAEDWIWDVPESRAMERALWIFVGSYERRLRDGSGGTRYVADSIGSLVTIYHDASAVLENPWPGADDTRYHANVQAVPAVGTPLTLRFLVDR